MNKLYTFMLGLLLPMAAVAQQEVATVPLSNFPLPIKTLEEISPAVDEAGNICLYLTHESSISHMGSIQFLALSPEGQVLAKTKFQNEFLNKQELLGALDQQKNFLFYRYGKQGSTHEVTPFLVEKLTGVTTPLPALTLDLDRKSKFITSFVEDNEVVMLYYLKKPGSIQVLRLDAQGKQHLQTIPIDIDYGPDRFVRYGEVVYMDENAAKTVFAGHYQKKVYKQGSKIHFVFDSFSPAQRPSATTEILELDLNTSTSKLAKLPPLPTGVSTDFNSYLFRDRIFRLQVSRSDLSLTVFDLHSQKQLATYLFGKDDELTLKSTPVVKRGAASIYESDYKVLEKTSQVLRKMDKGKPAITVEDLGNETLQLTIGSYTQPSSSGGGVMLVPMAGGAIGAASGMATMPATWMHMGGTGFYWHGNGVSTYFKSFVHADTFEKVMHEEVKSVQDQIDEYEEVLRQRNTRVGAKTIYKVNGNAFLMYEDIKEKALKLVMFTASAQQ